MPRALKRKGNSYQLAEQNLKQIFDKLPDPIFVTDRHGNVLLSNSTTALTLDMTLDQLLKSNIKDLVKKGFYSKSYAVEAAEQKCIKSGILTTKLNLVQYSSSTPIIDENGEVILVVTCGRPYNRDNRVSSEELASNSRQKREIEYLRSYVLETDTIVSESRLMKEVLFKAHSVAQVDSTVLLYGESGTGKEVLAKYIHRHSKRSQEAFIAINCANLPEQLVESELFGYEKGAFTGANSEGKMGLFEAAHRGTLFLDEIAELPLSLQSKLLRVLETGEVRRLGSNVDRKMDFRLIAATHKDLKKMMDDGLFRSDLYYRLDVIPITIPPLRERPDDIVALALKFLADFNKKYELNCKLDANTLAAFQNYKWPGNVRELRSAVERRVITSLQENQASSFLFDDVASSKLSHSDCFKLLGLNGTLKEVLSTVEERYISKVLQECDGRICETAKRLGIYRTVLYRKLKEFEKDKASQG